MDPNSLLSHYDYHVTNINCVYAISGTYGLLPRLLFYVTLVLAIFGRSREWLVIGALVSALTYAGMAAIHMMALVRNRVGVYDLDIMASWAVLSTGALAYIGLIHWSSTLRNSQARVVMICWGILVGISLIFGRSILFSTPLSDPEPACYSSRGVLLEYPMQLLSPEFNCTYQCFSLSRPMRHRSEIIAVPHRMVDNQYTRLGIVLVGPIQFAAYAALSLDTQNHTPSHTCVRWVMSYLIKPGCRDHFIKTVYNASMESWYGGYFALFYYTRRMRLTAGKLVVCAFAIPWLVLGLILDILCLPMMVANIVINEVIILSGNLPTNEADIAIGQWGPVVSSMLVVIAACIQRGLEWWDQRKNTKELDSVTDSAAPTIVGSDLEEGMRMRDDRSSETDQEVGVVKPKLAHVQTLKEMDFWTDRPK